MQCFESKMGNSAEAGFVVAEAVDDGSR